MAVGMGGRSLPKVPCQVHATESFYRDVDSLRELLGAEAEDVLKDLAKAVETLEGNPPDLPVRRTGWYGDTFGYAFRVGFVLTFRRATDRDQRNQPILVHLYLKRVMQDS